MLTLGGRMGSSSLRVHALEKLVTFVTFKRSGESPLVFRRHFEDFSHPLVRRKIKNLFRSQIGIQPLLAAACAFIICESCFSPGQSWISTSLFALLFLLIAFQLRLVNSAFGWIGRKRLLAIRNRFDHLLGRKIFDNLAGVHAERAQWHKTCLQSMVVDFIGVQLLVYPLIHAHGHAIGVARTRAKRQTVERVYRALLLRHLRTGSFLAFLGESPLCAQR